MLGGLSRKASRVLREGFLHCTRAPSGLKALRMTPDTKQP